MTTNRYLLKLVNNEFVQGASILTLNAFATNFVNYFFNFAVAHRLGPVAFGDLATMMSYLTILSVPIGILSLVVIQKVAGTGHQREEYAKAYESWFTKKFLKWWPLLIPVLLLTPYIPTITKLSVTSSIAMIFLLIFSIIGGFYDSLFQGARMFKIFALVNFQTILIKFLGAVLVFASIGQYSLLILFLVVSSLFKVLISRQYLSLNSNQSDSIVLEVRILTAIRSNLVLLSTASLMGITLIGNADIVIAKRFFGPVDAGIYSAWSLLSKIIMYAAGSVISISYIYYSSLDKRKHHQNTLSISIILITSFSMLSIFAYTFAGKQIVTLLFGSRFITAAEHLTLAGIFGSEYLFIHYINNYFISQKSKYSLVAPIFIPVYIALLLINTSSVVSFMKTNVIFASLMCITYIIIVAKLRLKSIA